VRKFTVCKQCTIQQNNSSKSGCRVQGAGCRGQGAGDRVQGAGCGGQGAGFKKWRNRPGCDFRLQSHPSKHQPYKKISYYYRPKSSFLCKIFKNQIRKLLTLRLFLIFEKIFELFEFRSDRSFAHVGCRRQPAPSLSMRLAVKLLQSRRDGTMSNPR
jgi:hypothetical protein